jgi:hypothetical protein
MADEKPQQQLQWYPSPQYRLIHSNYFRYRINSGEMTLHFDSITDINIPPNMAGVIVGEVSVAMTWTQAKALMRTLEVTIAVIEKEMGEIPMATATPEMEAVERQRIRNLIYTLYGRTPPT